MNPQFSFRVSAGVTVLQTENRFWKVRFDYEPFEGAHVAMIEEMEGKPALHYADRIEDVLGCGLIAGRDQSVVGASRRNENVYRLTGEELHFLRGVQRVIEWAQENSFWIEINGNPQLAELDLLGPAPTEFDVELHVSPV